MGTFKCMSLAVIFIFLSGCAEPEADILERVTSFQQQGKIREADSLINRYLAEHPDAEGGLKEQLEFELERNRRILLDYSLTEDALFEQLQKRIEDVDRREFEAWVAEPRFDYILLDGERHFVGPSVSNLFFRYPDLRDRKINRSTESRQARLTYTQALALQELDRSTPQAVRLPRRCEVTQTLTVLEGRVPPGEKVSCWIPYPVIAITQGEVQMLSASHEVRWLDSPTSTIRSVYLEGVMPESGDLVFSVSYRYTAYAWFRTIDPGRVLPFSGDEPEYLSYTREDPPHKVFSEEMTRLAQSITGDEANPYIRARLIYDWITENISYSYAREYSTLHNISAYCLENRYGDCGQEAILFITLCRIAGIPARWQSGFLTYPGDEGMHDWTEIYIRPYGWLPVDPYMGIYFTSVTEDLTAEQRADMHAFYFGNIDHYRLVANKGHNQELYPPKLHYRSETVDFQRGEVEWSGGNLYFPDWRWRLTVNEIPQ